MTKQRRVLLNREVGSANSRSNLSLLFVWVLASRGVLQQSSTYIVDSCFSIGIVDSNPMRIHTICTSHLKVSTPDVAFSQPCSGIAELLEFHELLYPVDAAAIQMALIRGWVLGMFYTPLAWCGASGD